MIFLIPLSLLAFLVSCGITVAEIRCEKDWPRDTGWYPVVFAFSTMLLVFAA